MIVKTKSAAPLGKVAAGGAAGALSVILLWMLSEFGGIQVPGDVAAAFTLLLSTAAAYLMPLVPGELELARSTEPPRIIPVNLSPEDTARIAEIVRATLTPAPVAAQPVDDPPAT